MPASDRVNAQLIAHCSVATGDGVGREFKHASCAEIGPRHQKWWYPLTQPNHPVSFVDQYDIESEQHAERVNRISRQDSDTRVGGK